VFGIGFACTLVSEALPNGTTETEALPRLNEVWKPACIG